MSEELSKLIYQRTIFDSALCLGPPLILNVQTFCFVVVWNHPNLPCDDIMGYEVRLYNPGSGQEVIHQVSRLSTYYAIRDRDKLQVELKEAHVQV